MENIGGKCPCVTLSLKELYEDIIVRQVGDKSTDVFTDMVTNSNVGWRLCHKVQNVC